MFWPLVLPIQITLVLLPTAYVIVVTTVPRFRKRPKRAGVLSLLLLPLLFIPSCIGVNAVVDRYRFGVFSYPDFNAVQDFRVEQFLPMAATQITIRQYQSGFHGRFDISETDLKTWHTSMWKKHKQYSVIDRDDDDMQRHIESEQFQRRYGEFGWEPPDDLIQYMGPQAANGSGYTLWYSASRQQAYQHGGYW